MQKGFKSVVVDLIRENPGHPAEKYAEVALERGLCGSDAENPVQSLASTLAKECREKRTPNIKAIKVNGKLCYFPIDQSPPETNALTHSEMAVSVILTSDELKVVDNLVNIGKFKSHNEALYWLVREGIKAKKKELDYLKEIVNEIKQMKESVTI